MAGVLEGLNILVAEDNEPSLELALVLLRAAGAVPVGVKDGGAVVDAVAAADYDAVLMDVRMPVMDGHTATKAIRDAEKAAGTGRHTLIIGVTAHAMPEHHEACFSAGMDAVITKPLDPGGFAQSIREHIDAGVRC